jgi:phosphatidylethanolamine-binding protein (PEBP) family uncharacterized protein/predicted small lipoprotein YifL
MRHTGHTHRPPARKTHITRTRNVVLTVTALALTALTVIGCGRSSTLSPPPTTANATQPRGASTSTPPEGEGPSTSPHQANTDRHAHAPRVSIEVSIPGLPIHEPQIPTRYTCDGPNISLPLKWTEVPSHTAQLAVFLANLRPVDGKLFFDWAVTGLSPTSHGMPAGKPPPGAIVARNSYGAIGYSICPPKGTSEAYIARVIALAHPLTAKPGFDPQTLFQEAERDSKNVGIAGATYKRP